MIAKEHVPLDIIVDDGSHVTEHQFLSAVCLLPLVKSGGIYVVEDVKRDNLNMFALDNIRQNAQKYNIDDHKIDRFLRDIEKIETHIDFGPFKDKNGQGLIIIYKKPSVQ